MHLSSFHDIGHMIQPHDIVKEISAIGSMILYQVIVLASLTTRAIIIVLARILVTLAKGVEVVVQAIILAISIVGAILVFLARGGH